MPQAKNPAWTENQPERHLRCEDMTAVHMRNSLHLSDKLPAEAGAGPATQALGYQVRQWQ